LSLWGSAEPARQRVFCRVSALVGGAEPLDLLGAPLDDEAVLDAVALLLAAVELPLPLGISYVLNGWFKF
jgi:hypothetical protein